MIVKSKIIFSFHDEHTAKCKLETGPVLQSDFELLGWVSGRILHAEDAFRDL
jgi:hypothetical protein